MQIRLWQWGLASALALISFGPLANQAAANRKGWVRIYTTAEHTVYIHRDSMTRKGSRRYFWAHFDFNNRGNLRSEVRPSNPHDPAFYFPAGANVYYLADCEKRWLSAQGMELYNAWGGLIQAGYAEDEKTSPVVRPDTPDGEGLIQYACARGR